MGKRLGEVIDVASDAEGSPEGGQPPALCVVCLKQLRAEKRRLRGTRPVVCGPSCAREVDHAPWQYVEPP